ncbi:hypothetical protein H6P87_00730 [Rickettsia tillamookensis]|uniref:Uncharacterized protein n=1 Tax=Rickettsia tillamookensis TaxID=2761623 RepID=A0A9E6MI10_9RICK|nr:hypothetical protein [Rickettsia tillamookensis]QQV75184.1 hypothetical protein H6P87_00730 [Rickettsia tillamookensis]
MKINYNDFFAESIIEEIDNEADQLIKKAEAELGLRDDNYFKKQTQEVIEHVLKNAIFTNGANIEHLWTAINETNLAKMTELKSKIAGN